MRSLPGCGSEGIFIAIKGKCGYNKVKVEKAFMGENE